jgi:hypothetical protein
MNPGQILRLVTLDQSLNEVGHAPDSGGVLSLTGSEGTRNQRIEGAIDERVAVDEEETG